ncbi:hypothetical protein EVAR_95397_1 [Eumeta japonica]|uniref:Uncharacterized protein n=1 Tax=Eumeta variegata TaxID=151549 RepID=A0A4C1VJM8_EUMVA|nr:hypothetical protein EVAR_95397_1 [Eumeta japonica]
MHEKVDVIVPLRSMSRSASEARVVGSVRFVLHLSPLYSISLAQKIHKENASANVGRDRGRCRVRAVPSGSTFLRTSIYIGFSTDSEEYSNDEINSMRLDGNEEADMWRQRTSNSVRAKSVIGNRGSGTRGVVRGMYASTESP